MNPHLSDDSLVDVLYGLASDAERRHARSCPQCRERQQAFEQRRVESAVTRRQTPAEVLTQRLAVRARIEESPRRTWAPAWVAGGVLAVFLVTYQPGAHVTEKGAGVIEAANDVDLTEVLSLELAGEPLAAAPLRGLFESESPE